MHHQNTPITKNELVDQMKKYTYSQKFLNPKIKNSKN